MQSWMSSVGLMELNGGTIFVRLALAVVCSGVMGYERMRKLRAAGLRTYILVCVGACMAMMTGIFVVDEYGGDPSRIAAQVVSGIGFLGAGTIILTDTHKVKGLTTAAGLWAVGCMGIAFGAGFYGGALVMFVLALAAMVLGEKFQNAVLLRGRRLQVFVLFNDAESLKAFLEFLKEQDLQLTDFENEHSVGNCVSATFMLKIPQHMRLSHEELLKTISERPGVAFASEA